MHAINPILKEPHLRRHSLAVAEGTPAEGNNNWSIGHTLYTNSARKDGSPFAAFSKIDLHTPERLPDKIANKLDPSGLAHWFQFERPEDPRGTKNKSIESATASSYIFEDSNGINRVIFILGFRPAMLTKWFRNDCKDKNLLKKAFTIETASGLVETGQSRTENRRAERAEELHAGLSGTERRNLSINSVAASAGGSFENHSYGVTELDLPIDQTSRNEALTPDLTKKDPTQLMIFSIPLNKAFNFMRKVANPNLLATQDKKQYKEEGISITAQALIPTLIALMSRLDKSKQKPVRPEDDFQIHYQIENDNRSRCTITPIQALGLSLMQRLNIMGLLQEALIDKQTVRNTGKRIVAAGDT